MHFSCADLRTRVNNYCFHWPENLVPAQLYIRPLILHAYGIHHPGKLSARYFLFKPVIRPVIGQLSTFLGFEARKKIDNQLGRSTLIMNDNSCVAPRDQQ